MESLLTERDNSPCATSANPTETRYAYTREMMMTIKELSHARPDYLSPEFNDETGRFVPDKWFDQIFASEAGKAGLVGRKKNLSRMEDELGLSPQRRQFAGGCVPGSTKNTSTSSKWSNGRTETNNADPKSKLNNKARWRKKTDESSPIKRDDGVPEWMESDITIKDIMELKGFDGTYAATSKLPPAKPAPPRVYSETDLLEDIKRKSAKPEVTEQPLSGSRFIHMFKRNNPDSNLKPVEEIGSSSSINLNNLFSQTTGNLPSMPYLGRMASDVEGRFNNQNNNKGISPDPISVMTNPSHVTDVFIPNRQTANDDEDLFAEILRRASISEVGNPKKESEIFKEMPDRPLSPMGFGLASFDVHPSKIVSPQTQHSPEVPLPPPGFSKPQNGSASPLNLINTGNTGGLPPMYLPNYPNGYMPPPPQMMCVPGPNGMPMFSNYGMPFAPPPGMMPNMNMHLTHQLSAQGMPPSGSGHNLPTSVLLRRKNPSSRNSPEVVDEGIHSMPNNRHNVPLPEDVNRRMDPFYHNPNEHPSMEMMNMYNMMSMMSGNGAQKMPGMGYPHGFSSYGGPMYPPHQQMPPQQHQPPPPFDDFPAAASNQTFSHSPVPMMPHEEPFQQSRIPESIMKSIPTSAKMMTVEDLERALLAKK